MNAVLEHLFENGELMAYFDDWKDDPSLAEAYSAAVAWVKEAPDGFTGCSDAFPRAKEKGH